MKDISKVLGDISLTDEQISALDEFFESYSEKIKEQTSKQHADELEAYKENAEQAFELFREDAEKAFNLFRADAEKAFNLFHEDAEKAFSLGVDELKNEYAEHMVVALEDLYGDVEERVKADFFESQEYKAIEKVRSAVAPLLLSEEQKSLMEKVAMLEAEKNAIVEEKQELTREKIISTLLKDFPSQYEESVRKFITAAKSEEEIYERFDQILEMLNIGDGKLAITESDESEEDDDEEEEDSFDEDDAEDSDSDSDEDEVLEESSRNPFIESIYNTSTKEEKSTKERNRYFSESEEALINLVFPQVM